MQAIINKYLGPTNHRGSRIKATCYSGTITIGFDHELSGEAAHKKAAMALIERLKWSAPSGLTVGATPSGNGYVFIPSSMTNALAACTEVLNWAATPGDHGGKNPYSQKFVYLAQKALGVPV